MDMLLLVWLVLASALIICMALRVRCQEDAIEGLRELFGNHYKAAAAALEAVKRLEGDVSSLKEGVTPDYEKAVAAARAVNNFNDGLANIIGFDPIAALRKQEEDAT